MQELPGHRDCEWRIFYHIRCMMALCSVRVKGRYIVVSLCLSESLYLHTFRNVWCVDKRCGGENW